MLPYYFYIVELKHPLNLRLAPRSILILQLHFRARIQHCLPLHQFLLPPVLLSFGHLTFTLFWPCVSISSSSFASSRPVDMRSKALRHLSSPTTGMPFPTTTEGMTSVRVSDGDKSDEGWCTDLVCILTAFELGVLSNASEFGNARGRVRARCCKVPVLPMSMTSSQVLLGREADITSYPE
jgi:hypothetical protein